MTSRQLDSRKLPSDADWKRWKIERPLSQVFFLQWVELFDLRATDTWQVRTLNARKVLQEIISVVETAEREPRAAHNIPFVVDEALGILRRDPIVNDRYAFAIDYLKPFNHEKASDIDKPALRETARLLLSYLKAYGRDLADRLATLIDTSEEQKEKAEIVALAGALATDLQGRGYSPEHLLGLRSVLEQPKDSFGARVRRLEAQCPEASRAYEVVVPTWCRYPLSTTDGRLRSLTPAEKWGESVPEKFVTLPPKGRVLVVDLEAVDPHAAFDKAVRHAADVLSAQNLFEQAKNLGVLPLFGRVESAEEVVWIEQKARTQIHGFRRNANDTQQHLQNSLDWLASRSAPDRRRIGAALEYHRLALSAPTIEAELVNLWIALEALTRTSSDGSIIGQVCEHVLAAVTLNYPRELLRDHVAKAWSRVLKHAEPDARAPWAKRQGRRPDVTKILRALADKREGELINALYAMLHPDQLLLHRTYYLRQTIFREPKSLATALETHETNIDWQLRRIYRARNMIVHNAGAVLETPQLTQHLHTYFTTTLHAIRRATRRFDPGWSLDDAFRHLSSLQNNVVSTLAKDPSRISADVVLDPDLLLRPGPSTPLWPHQGGATNAESAAPAAVSHSNTPTS